MKTVPTLCATATVVGASAVGLSFGREHPLDSPSKRKASPARELDHHASMSATVQTTAPPPPTTTTAAAAATSATTTTTTKAPATSTATPARSLNAPTQLATSARVPVATRQSHENGRPQRRIVRRMTGDDASMQPPTAVTPSADPLHEDQVVQPNDPPHMPARRPSWIKRLSTISTSQCSSRNSSPGPLSPSVSCSNGSMAFSHDGSTAPIVGERPRSPLPPNKLVKRSSSVRMPQERPVTSSGARLPSLRRPATSHQRSASWQRQTALIERASEDVSADEQPPHLVNSDNEAEYMQFFTTKTAKETTRTRRRGSTVAGRGIRRIVPDDRRTPMLLRPQSVTASAGAGAGAGAGEDEASTSDDGESVFFVSRPGTPLGITVIATQTDAAAQSSSNRPSAELGDDAAARPRRSFSITDLLSPASKHRARLARKASTRASSAPLPAMGGRQSHTAHGEPAAARRDLSDPALARRDMATAAGPARHGSPRASIMSSTPPALPSQRSSVAASMPRGDARAASPPSTNHAPPLPALAQTGGRPCRHSVAPSEHASTLVGSDNEARGLGSGDEDDADLQSETVFDSLRTGATRSTSGARGPRIETIFDESPPAKVKVTALRDLLPKGTFREHPPDGAPGQHSIAEEEESISTPVRTIVPDRSIHSSPSLARGHSAPLFPALLPSSPPDMPKPLSLGTLAWHSRAGADDSSSSRWSSDAEDNDDHWDDLPTRPPATQIAAPVSLGRHNPRLLALASSPNSSSPLPLAADQADREARSSIFDWSEQQPTDKSSGNRTPPRPRTGRGSRSAGRRAPSGLHARSQSVPVVPDATGKRSTVVTNKFGTWGVGSKGVTEDWNDDFEFSDLNEEPAIGNAAESQRLDSATAMVVPKNIQEQQSNVLANIGLLREWGLLIEELKEQRGRAVALGLLEGPSAGMWEEVDAMIDLADQEADHDGISRLSPPSSPGFDEDAFDDVSGSTPNHGRGRRKSGLTSEELGKHCTPPPAQSHQPRRKTILPPNNDIFGPQSSPIPPKSRYESPSASPTQKPIANRPRKDSEAKARSVIEALQKRKNAQDSIGDVQLTPASKKVPFDTATLRRIVPYVNTLTRKVKETLREAEGLYTSPITSPKQKEPPLSRIFQQDAELATQMKLMTVM